MTETSTRPELVALEIADSAERWEALGFNVSQDRVVELGGVQLRLDADGEGIVAWALRGIGETDSIDGLPTQVEVPDPVALGSIDQSVNRGEGQRLHGEAGGQGLQGEAEGQRIHGEAAVTHPNGAIAVDHVVILTSDFDRTAHAVAAAGMPLRREAERNGARQGFRRLGPAIMEIVQAPEGPTRFWGLVVIVTDLDALARRLGVLLAGIRPAVQPGRRIAPLRSEAGLSCAVAFMDPS